MTTHEILSQLDRQLPEHPIQVTTLTPYDIAELLRFSGDALVSLIRTIHEEQDVSNGASLSENKIQIIQSLFQELSQNFFPMAHTTDPLSQLRIYNEEAIQDVGYRLRRATEHVQEATRFLANEVELKYRELTDL